MIRRRWIGIMGLVACLSVSTVSESASSPKGLAPYLRVEDFALKVCLNDNYTQLGGYQIERLRDYSEAQLDAEATLALIQFVKANTQDFYREQLPLHIESTPPPYNAVFARCMDFYHSDKLRAFIKDYRQI